MARKCQTSNLGLSLILNLWPQFVCIGLKGKEEKEEGEREEMLMMLLLPYVVYGEHFAVATHSLNHLIPVTA